MKLRDSTGYIWIAIDEYGDMETEWFYPETIHETMPNELNKYLMDYPESTAKRLKILPVEPQDR